ncbi:hypothetical protein ES703_12047 [subsurface metagenome]
MEEFGEGDRGDENQNENKVNPEDDYSHQTLGTCAQADKVEQRGKGLAYRCPCTNIVADHGQPQSFKENSSQKNEQDQNKGT